ncbi:MAG: FAD-dependent oxidoreductase, partial [Pseudomonadota bacterium]
YIGYSAGPTLAVARSEEQLVQLNHLRDALSSRDVPYRVLSARNIADEAPFLCSGIDHAVSIASDGQVDNRAVLTALGSICRKAGLEIQTAADIDADIVLRTIGVSDPQTRPVKGQAIAFQPFSDAPDQVVRCGSLYIVPKPDRVIVGATVEAGKNDIVVDPHVPDQLQDAAARICPAIAEQMPIEHWAGVRPQTTDHAPIIGSQGKDTFLATGHYRNGILLAPITARLIADMVLTDEVSELAAQFSPRRFMPATA